MINQTSLLESSHFPVMLSEVIHICSPKKGGLFVDCTLTTTNTRLSPVIDTSRISMITVQNRVNSPTSLNTPSFINDEASSGSSSAAIYCTRPIVLENNSTALEVRLTSYVRSSSEVEVYFRTTSSEEVRDVKD